jgi:4-hydroxybenzoate polyprenyltransferase
MFSKQTKKIIAFLRLIRVHRPIPILLLIFPAFIIMLSQTFLIIKSNGIKDFSKYLEFSPFWLSIKILIGGFVARSLGCVINDFFDQKIDSNSERTSGRPFVANDQNKWRLLPQDGIVLGGSLILTLIGLSIMITLKFGSIIICIIAAFLTFIYPLTKRFLSVPQVALGFTYGLSVLIIGFETSSQIKISHLIFYLGTAFYIFSYDSIYAMQDREDDLKNQMHSAPLAFGSSLSFVISKSYNLSFILFAIFGILDFLSFGFYAGVVLGFLYIKFLIKNLDSKENKDFQKIFELNFIPLFLIIFGLLIDISLLIFF